MRWYRRLIAAAVLLTFALIMLGAWVRLTDAGLGCPDWPGCYGKLTPAHAADQIDRAVTAQGGEHGPVSTGKAWREMIHRYVAGALGLLIVMIAGLAWRYRAGLRQSPWLATSLVAVVVLQALFGMWTVTLQLRPAIVTGHLVGGMLTLSLLVWLGMREFVEPQRIDFEPLAALRPPLLAGLLLLAAQIFLGGWTSTNYAALACPDLPTCQGSWWPSMDFSAGFQIFRELGKTDTGAVLPAAALTAIHWMHRVGALIVTLLLGSVAAALWRAKENGLAIGLATALVLQVLLGLSNIWTNLKLGVAVAHNGGAALLLAVLVVLNFRAYRAGWRI